MMGGRVKTLHPKVYGGILARRDNCVDMKELAEQEINTVDMVVCNLYPFVETALKPGASVEHIIEQIDIGGPAMLRAAAKNWRWVTVICNPLKYDLILDQIRSLGQTTLETRRDLAVEVFRHTSAYDSAIASYFAQLWHKWPLDFPQELTLGFNKVFSLRYGENPHQKASFYEPVLGSDVSSLKDALIQGKELSYNNIFDADGALKAVCDLKSTGCVIVKHAGPCGAALGETPSQAFSKALKGDPVSAYGGVVAFNCEVDEECALAMKRLFVEVLIAPSYTPEALKVLSDKKKLRVLVVSPREQKGGKYAAKFALGGLLIQSKDDLVPENEEWTVVSKRAPGQKEMEDLHFAMTICKHVKSNAIVLAKDNATVGIGGGQPNRVDAVRIAVARARERARGSCMASDAFFPFPDSVEEAHKAGVTAIAHPGGSIRDKESLEVADSCGMAMVVTGIRHFALKYTGGLEMDVLVVGSGARSMLWHGH